MSEPTGQNTAASADSRADAEAGAVRPAAGAASPGPGIGAPESRSGSAASQAVSVGPGSGSTAGESEDTASTDPASGSTTGKDEGAAASADPATDSTAGESEVAASVEHATDSTAGESESTASKPEADSSGSGTAAPAPGLRPSETVPPEPGAVLPEVEFGETAKIVAVVVTHKRRELLTESLKAIAVQTRPVDHLIVVDNGNEPEVADLVREQSVETTYLGSAHNLGGAGGFALGILHALTLGADWVWLADDDGRPEGSEVLATLFSCARRHRLVEVSPVVCDIDNPDRLAFPLRRGVVWRRLRSELGGDDFLPGIASLFNGALISAQAVDVIGVPDLRLFVRGDEVEVHRRLVRSGLPFGTCLQTAYLHPNGSAEFKPILGGRMHTQYPDDPVKRYFTYRNRGYLMSQPGMRKLLPQEWIRFSWFFLVTRRDPAGLREWFHLRSLGRNEQFQKPE